MMDERGFAMADAIIALVLMSSLLASLIGLNRTSLHTAQKAESHLVATLILQAVVEDRSIRNNSGTFTIDGRNYSWTRERREQAGRRNGPVVLDDITITVRWRMNSGENQTTLKTSRWRTNDN